MVSGSKQSFPGAALACFPPLFLVVATSLLCFAAIAQTDKLDTKQTWKPVPFAILKFNDEAPKSWNIYHTERRGVLLVRLWKRFLLVDLSEQLLRLRGPGWVGRVDPKSAVPVS
jgi:hypothetical protein